MTAPKEQTDLLIRAERAEAKTELALELLKQGYTSDRVNAVNTNTTIQASPSPRLLQVQNSGNSGGSVSRTAVIPPSTIAWILSVKSNKPFLCFMAILLMLAIVVDKNLTQQTRQILGIGNGSNELNLSSTSGNLGSLVSWVKEFGIEINVGNGGANTNTNKTGSGNNNPLHDDSGLGSGLGNNKAARLDAIADKTLAYMQINNMTIRKGDRRFNIVYIRGMNDDGTPNNRRPNYFDDMGGLIEIPSGSDRPRFVFTWKATTRPGDGYVENPMSSTGFTAQIVEGQNVAWKRGLHRGRNALVQVRPIAVLRLDKNRQTVRKERGLFAINQHDYLKAFIVTSETPNNFASAGCLVSSKKTHRQLMSFVSIDRDYKNNPDFIFPTLVIDRKDLGL